MDILSEINLMVWYPNGITPHGAANTNASFSK